jgi:vacuolar-type H+-ATPase subunit E/Vma4
VSLDALLDAVERRGRQEVERVLAEAREASDALERAARERADRARQEALHRLEARRRSEAEAELAAARREARERVLRARQTLLEAVFAAVEEALPDAARSEPYRQSLPGLVTEAFGCVEARGARVECAPDLREAVLEALRRPRPGGVSDPGEGSGAEGGAGTASGPGGAPDRHAGLDGVEVRPSPEASTGIRVLSSDGRVVVDETLGARVARLRPRLAILVLEALG